MPDIFNSRAGVVAAISSPNVIPGRIKIGDFAPTAGLISGVSYNQQTNQQFQYALDGTVYIYVFGDLMGDLAVSGIAFPAMCSGGGGFGLTEVFDFYKSKRASKNPDLVNIVVGDEIIVGFLTAIKVRSRNSAEDPAALFNEWDLLINTLPKD